MNSDSFVASGSSPQTAYSYTTPHDTSARSATPAEQIKFFALLHEIAEVAAVAVARCYSVKVGTSWVLDPTHGVLRKAHHGQRYVERIGAQKETTI
jgi:hypothetical protein